MAQEEDSLSFVPRARWDLPPLPLPLPVVHSHHRPSEKLAPAKGGQWLHLIAASFYVIKR